MWRETDVMFVGAGGGTAAGFSGDGCGGYLAGVGLLSAFALGKICGEEASWTLS